MTNITLRGNDIRYGTQLYLAAPTQASIDSFSDAPLSEAILTYLSDGQSAVQPTTANTIAQQIKSREGITFALCLIENDNYIGYASLAEINWQARYAHLKIAILDEKHLNGAILTDTIQTVLQFVYAEANLNRIEMRCVDDHVLLHQALEACHFTQEGNLRHHAYRNGHYHDVLIYSILGREWSTLDS